MFGQLGQLQTEVDGCKQCLQVKTASELACSPCLLAKQDPRGEQNLLQIPRVAFRGGCARFRDQPIDES